MLVDLLLSCPLHELVSDEQRGGPVEDLATGAAESVEDRCFEGTGKRVLSVLCEAVVNDALLREGAC